MMVLSLLVLAALPAPDPVVPGNPIILRGHRDAVLTSAFSADGKWLATGSRDNSVRVWDLSSGKETASFGSNERAQINSIAWSPDATLIAIGTVELEVRLVEVSTGSIKRRIPHPDAVMEVAFSPDGKSLAVAGAVGNGAIYTVADGKKRFDISARTVTYSGDGATLLVATRPGGVKLLDASNGKVKSELTTTPHVPIATMTRDGALWASWNGKENDVRLYDGRTAKALEPLKGPKSSTFEDAKAPTVSSIAFTPDGKTLLVASLDHVIRFWEVATRTVTRTLPLEGVGFIAVSPDGKWVVAGDVAAVKLWPMPAAR